MEVAGYIVSIVLIAITVVILAFAFGLDGGLSEKVVNAVQGKTDQFIKESEQEAYRGDLVKLPDEHEQAIFKLNETIHQMLRSGNEDCFANYATVSAQDGMYNGFPPLQEEGVSIILNYDETAQATHFKIYGGQAGEQLVTDWIFSIPGMKPCVIAGSEEIVGNFFAKFIEKREVVGDYYSLVNSIQILDPDAPFTTYDGLTTYDEEGNSIRVPGYSIFDNEYNNLLDGGWIFTPGNGLICFIPTTDVNNIDSSGIDNDYVSGEEENSIRSRLREGSLEQC